MLNCLFQQCFNCFWCNRKGFDSDCSMHRFLVSALSFSGHNKAKSSQKLICSRTVCVTFFCLLLVNQLDNRLSILGYHYFDLLIGSTANSLYHLLSNLFGSIQLWFHVHGLAGTALPQRKIQDPSQTRQADWILISTSNIKSPISNDFVT